MRRLQTLQNFICKGKYLNYLFSFLWLVPGEQPHQPAPRTRAHLPVAAGADLGTGQGMGAAAVWVWGPDGAAGQGLLGPPQDGRPRPARMPRGPPGPGKGLSLRPHLGTGVGLRRVLGAGLSGQKGAVPAVLGGFGQAGCQPQHSDGSPAPGM